MTTTTFDAAGAVRQTRASLFERVGQIRETLEAETQVAAEAVERYADHLAAGGDPREGFERPQRYGDEKPKYLSPMTYVDRVYREWNEARGSRNPFSPVDELTKWEIAEYATERIGQPMLFADLREIPDLRQRARTSVQSDDIAGILAALQGDDLVLRRTKLDGKVAYLLRERQDGEEAAGRLWGDGRISLRAAEVPEERWSA